MGTRSLTVFLTENGEEIAVMYRQFDGYPEGHGMDLAEFLSGITMVNGLGAYDEKVANGMGCLTAQVVSHFKERPGDIYLHPAGTRDCWEEYIYIVSFKDFGKELYIQVQQHNGKSIMEGYPNDIIDAISKSNQKT